MKLRMSSLRTKLLLWLLIPILSLWLIGGTITYFIAIHFANAAYDNALSDSARILMSRLSYEKNGRVNIDLPPAAREILEQDDQDTFYYQVISPKGRLISGEPLFPIPPHNPDDEDDNGQSLTFSDGVIHHQPVRIATLIGPFDTGHPKDGIATVQVAETMVGRQQLATKISISVVLPQLVMIVLAAAVVWIGISRGLEPLDKIRQALSRRTTGDLHPLNENESPYEIRPLVLAINQLLQRLAEDMDIQRRFVANAAHQLRTPLAGLKTQTDLAIRQTRQDDPNYHALSQINTSITRANRLVRQLLVLARAEPGLREQPDLQLLNISTVVKEATGDLVPQALHKKIALEFEQEEDRALWLKGDSLLLKELIVNLIENAIRYTPEQGRVLVMLSGSENSVELMVRDNGMGIPAEERTKVFERFYRVLANGSEGSGLGLAIVQEIAQQHQALITLEPGLDQQGTTFKIRFPRCVAPAMTTGSPAKS